MQIITSSGKKFNADWVLDTTTRHGAQQLTIQLPGETDLGEILGELDGAEQIIVEKDKGVRTVYEGYSLFSSAIYTPDRKALRVTLERNDAA